MLYGGKTYIPLFVYIFHYGEKYNCYAGVSMTDVVLYPGTPQ